MTSIPRTPRRSKPPPGQDADIAVAGTDPDVVLAALPIGTCDYLRVLGAILKKHNHLHSGKHKGVSLKTMHDRDKFIVSFFRQLRKTQYGTVDPRRLANRHVRDMVDRWVAKGLTTASIHNYLSYLRTFSSWIGKPGMVREPAFYLGVDSPHVRRHQIAQHDHSWTAMDVDVEAKIAEVLAFDAWVGLQLELCYRFALRAKEARHFRPHEGLIARGQANAKDAAAFPECAEFIRIEHGTKGGRTRDVPIRTVEQFKLLARLREVVPTGMYVGRPELTALQSQWRFYNVIRKFGINKKTLGVVAHGLRHQRVIDDFEADAGQPSPVRSQDAGMDETARLRAARLLGHSRSRITGAYIGARTPIRTTLEAAAAAADEAL